MTGFLFVVALAVTGFQVSWQNHPLEDAAILMRYAQHVAQGHGIVWNIGEKPVDGATDFLFTIVLAVLARIGIPIEYAARVVGLASHAATVSLIYVAAVRIIRVPRAIAVFLAGLCVAGPAQAYITGGFGTTFYAFFGTAAWWPRLPRQTIRPIAVPLSLPF